MTNWFITVYGLWLVGCLGFGWGWWGGSGEGGEGGGSGVVTISKNSTNLYYDHNCL